MSLFDALTELRNADIDGDIVMKALSRNLYKVIITPNCLSSLTGSDLEMIGKIAKKNNCFWYADFKYGYVVVFV